MTMSSPNTLCTDATLTTTTTTSSFVSRDPEMAYAELSRQFRRRRRVGDDGGGGEKNTTAAEEEEARMRALSRALEDLTNMTTREGWTLDDVRSSVAIAKKLIERGGDEENESIEKRHFGYSILQRLLSAAETTPARGEEDAAFALKNEFMNIISNELQLTARNGAREPYPLKSKVAQITAEFIKREGSVAWIAFSETVARMLRSVDAYECELGAIIAKYVAEDVALHSDEVFADKVRDLLGGMTQTIGEVTGAMREAWEKHFSTNNNNNNNSNSNNTSPEMQKASENCALAVLEAVSVYAEWAPLVPLVRSGLVDVCCMALLSNTNESACRAPAASAIKHVLARKPLPDDVPQDDRAVVFMAISSCVCAVTTHIDTVLAQEYNALDNADVYEQCTDLACQAASVQVLQMLSQGEQQQKQQQQLELVVALLERLAMLVRIPNLKSLETVLCAWTALLRANGATVPKKGHATTTSSMKPASSSSPTTLAALKILPPGAVPALLEYCVSWLRAGGGLAGGMDPTGTNITNEREQWEDAFETFEELKMQWITDRAKVMEVIKLCANLDPQSASRKLLEIVDGALEWLKSVSTAADGGGYSGDEGKACILEGVASFTECVMLVLPIEEQQASSAAIEIESLVMKALVLTDQSSQSGGIRLGPQSLAQYAKMLECFGRIGLVRPNLPPLLVKNLFDLLGTLSAEDVSAPPVRGKSRVKSTQLARQKICSAMLNICATVPEALNPHLEPLAEQVESLRSTNNLTGAERGTLAEALLAVATPSGPERVTQVLDWLLTPVKNRWYSVETGQVLPLVANLATPESFVAQQQEQEQLSNVHWDLFHDMQLLERCMRRCLPGGSAQAVQKVVQEAPSAQGEQQQQQKQQQFVCLISEHIEWSILLATEMHRLVRQIFTPRLQSQMASVHLAESLRPSWEEYAASLKPGKLKEFALEQGQNEIMTQLKVVSVRNWLRVLRDASLNIINLVSLHASEMMYSNPSIAEKVQTVISADLETQRDDQVRAMILLFVRPVLSRCPAQFRQIWFQALVAPILPDLCRRVELGWTTAGTNKVSSSSVTTSSEALDTSSDVSTYATLVAEAYSERSLREISRELGSILELIVAPDGTLGRRTKTASTSDTDKDAIAGGKHLIDWMCSQRDVQIAQIAIQAGTLAMKIDDLETVSKAILFCRGLVAAASVQDPRIGEGLAESCGGEIVFAAVTALSKSLNSSLQAELLCLICEVLTKHARTTKSVVHAMLCIPGITENVLVNTLEEISKCRSDKKAIGLVKKLLLLGEELKILATGDTKKTISAIQIPTNSKRRQGGGVSVGNPGNNDPTTSWTENEVHAGFQLFSQ